MLNNYNYTLGVFNGATGVIIAVDQDSRRVWVDFGNGFKSAETGDRNYQSALDRRTEPTPARNSGGLDAIEYKPDQLSQLKLAYAISIHKSQGSEFPCVVIPIHFLNKRMLVKNLLYTSVTRGKQLLVIVGDEKAIDFCIENDHPTQRYTYLQRFLKERF